MWDLAIPFNRPPVSARNAWEPGEYPRIGAVSCLSTQENLHDPATTAVANKCSPNLPELYLCAQTVRRACINTGSSASAIATVSMNAIIAATSSTTIPVTDLVTALRSAQDEWIEQQLRKIETLYHYHKEKQDA